TKFLAGGIKDLGVFARRLAPVREDPHTSTWRALGELLLDHARTGKSALLAPAAGDAPGKARLDRRGRGIDIVTIEAEAGFQAQGIPRTEPDGLHFRHRQQAPCQPFRRVVRNRDFETVLAGIARARDEAARPLDNPDGAGHEIQPAAVRREA